MNQMQAWKGILGDEYTKLSINEQFIVRQDYESAYNEDGVSLPEYRDRIGKGNLRSYASCLVIQEYKV